ncbi:hypothetical protein L249_1807 [Ophiocordyceps polyrhachis-furcata BCC 54312]|uniref:Uncharacterized protein n=1 Tax=Ophiocordyceps polyrhachis-furcata BCC 54312 TaxID=1330021 RepID=A0A367LRN0_9HYPO|nr:hypothetical protein L249_1807 [Ophiocordyceps polyrhachis-furcata BCC 54312]
MRESMYPRQRFNMTETISVNAAEPLVFNVRLNRENPPSQGSQQPPTYICIYGPRSTDDSAAVKEMQGCLSLASLKLGSGTYPILSHPILSHPMSVEAKEESFYIESIVVIIHLPVQLPRQPFIPYLLVSTGRG